MSEATTTIAMIQQMVTSTGQIINDLGPLLYLIVGLLFTGFAMFAILGGFKKIGKLFR